MKNYIDLGLPSGNLWCDTNEEGYYNWNDAVEEFGDSLPKLTDFAELYDYCKWEWNEEKKGLIITGSNGNSIFLPALGFRCYSDGSLHNVGGGGYYWSSSPIDIDYAYDLYFYINGYVSPTNEDNCAYSHSIRLIKRK